MPEHCLVDVSRQLILLREGLYDVLTVIGRGRLFLRCSGCSLLRVKRRVRHAIRGDDLHLP